MFYVRPRIQKVRPFFNGLKEFCLLAFLQATHVHKNVKVLCTLDRLSEHWTRFVHNYVAPALHPQLRCTRASFTITLQRKPGSRRHDNKTNQTTHMASESTLMEGLCVPPPSPAPSQTVLPAIGAVQGVPPKVPEATEQARTGQGMHQDCKTMDEFMEHLHKALEKTGPAVQPWVDRVNDVAAERALRGFTLEFMGKNMEELLQANSFHAAMQDAIQEMTNKKRIAWLAILFATYECMAGRPFHTAPWHFFENCGDQNARNTAEIMRLVGDSADGCPAAQPYLEALLEMPQASAVSALSKFLQTLQIQ